jgi:hypothetical protein
MTDQPTLLGHAEAPARSRRGPGGWEIALWILGVALVGGGVLIAHFVVDNLLSNDGSASNDPKFFAVAQVLYSILPGVITAGLFCFILAVALRAFEGNAVRRRAMAQLVQAQAPGVSASIPAASEPAAIAVAPVAPAADRHSQDVSPTATGDYSRFMRPPADAD